VISDTGLLSPDVPGQISKAHPVSAVPESECPVKPRPNLVKLKRND